ncbi:MAG TPA: tetratricopeptide repeat protein [Bryobacteraceae bacterium]|nr:tetratricopeptide repeat protein [Bryobacteraceae bacterium]
MARVLVPALLLIHTAFAQDADPAQLFREATEAQQHGDDALAVEKYRALIKLRPDSVAAHANLGAALTHLRRFDEAIAEYERALAGAPDQLQIRANLALAYYKAGRIDRAAAEFEKLHGLAPQEKRFTFLLADCWLQQGDNRKVIDLLEPLDAQNRDDMTFCYLYGTALMRDDRQDRAQEVMDRIFKNGDSAQARVLMASARMKMQDWKGAKADLDRAVEIDPALPGVHSLLGVVLDELMDNTAGAQYQKELEVNPNDFSANFHLGVYALHDNRVEAAEAYLVKALDMRPGDPGALLQLANVRSAQGKREEARGILEGVIQRYPDFREAHVVLASVYYRLKRRDDGDRENEIARKLSEKSASHIH